MDELRDIIRKRLNETDYEEHLENNNLESIDDIFMSIFEYDWIELYTHFPHVYVDDIFREEFARWDEIHYSKLIQ